MPGLSEQCQWAGQGYLSTPRDTNRRIISYNSREYSANQFLAVSYSL